MKIDQPIPKCLFCGEDQVFDMVVQERIYIVALTCTNPGCATNGPVREAESQHKAERLAVEAYQRASENLSKAVKLLEWVYSWVGNPEPQYDSDEIPGEIEDFLNSLTLNKARRYRVGYNHGVYEK